MATSLFAAPIGTPYFQALDNNGDPLNGGKLYTYEAGTTTPLATYPTYDDALAGTNANANPVVLDAYGRAQVWVQVAAMKFILKTGADVTVPNGTQDDVQAGSGYPQPAVSEWVLEATETLYLSPTAFTVTGANKTAIYHPGRRLRSNQIGGVAYSTVTSSSFATDTTVTVVNDSVPFDGGFANMSYGLTSYENPSYLAPRSALLLTKNGNMTGFATSTKVTSWTAELDSNSEWTGASSTWTPKHAGRYLVFAQMEYADTGTNVAVTLQLKDGTLAVVAQAATRSSPTASQIWSASLSYIFDSALASGSLQVYVLGSANTTVQGTVGTRLVITRIV